MSAYVLTLKSFLGSDQKNEISDTSNRNGFPSQGVIARIVRIKVFSLVKYLNSKEGLILNKTAIGHSSSCNWTPWTPQRSGAFYSDITTWFLDQTSSHTSKTGDKHLIFSLSPTPPKPGSHVGRHDNWLSSCVLVNTLVLTKCRCQSSTTELNIRGGGFKTENRTDSINSEFPFAPFDHIQASDPRKLRFTGHHRGVFHSALAKFHWYDGKKNWENEAHVENNCNYL